MTGSRDWTDAEQIRRTLDAAVMVFDRSPTPPVLVHGGCNMYRNARGAIRAKNDPPLGADAIAHVFWRSWGLPAEVHFADWKAHGKAAGMIRNQRMVALGADLVVGFVLDASPGATNCLDQAGSAGLRLDVIERRSPDAKQRTQTRPWTPKEATG